VATGEQGERGHRIQKKRSNGLTRGTNWDRAVKIRDMSVKKGEEMVERVGGKLTQKPSAGVLTEKSPTQRKKKKKTKCSGGVPGNKKIKWAR